MTQAEFLLRIVRRMLRESVPRPPRRLLVDFVSGVDDEVPVARVVYGSCAEITFAIWETPWIGMWISEVAAGKRSLSSALPVAEARPLPTWQGYRVTTVAWRLMRRSWRRSPRAT